MPELKTFTGTLAKSIDLPDEVLKSVKDGEVDHFFYATVEVEDREGDVIRVKGLKTAENVPFIVGHKLSPNSDGTLPVIGKTIGWQKTMHKSLGVPAMVVGVKFAPTALGKSFKEMYDDGYLTDVSARFENPKMTKMRVGGRYDVAEAEVVELSACVKGVNPYASLIKAMQDAGLDVGLPEAESTVSARLDAQDFSGVAKSLTDHLDAHFKSLTKRLDDLESAFVVKSHAAEQTDDTTSGTDHEHDWASLHSAIDALKKSLPTK